MELQINTPLELNHENCMSPKIYRKKSHWQLLRNVLKAVALFKRCEVHEAEDINVLINEIKQIPTDEAYRLRNRRLRENSPYNVVLKDIRREQSFRQCVERGKSEDLGQIKLEIEQDPYRIMRATNHPLALINKRDRNGQTPLYIACKNGNLEVVMLLIKEKADYLMTSLIEDEEETNLQVAVRWGHIRVVEELLKLKWHKNELEKAKRLCRTQDMHRLFKKSSRKAKCFCFSSKS